MAESTASSAEDQDFNPLLDAESDGESLGSDQSEFRLNVQQRMNALRDRLEDLSSQIDRFRVSLEERDATIELLRNTVRRLRFQRSPATGRDRTRDNVFTDACRRRFCEAWQGNPDYLNSMDVEHLSFLGHLLHLPALMNVSQQ